MRKLEPKELDTEDKRDYKYKKNIPISERSKIKIEKSVSENCHKEISQKIEKIHEDSPGDRQIRKNRRYRNDISDEDQLKLKPLYSEDQAVYRRHHKEDKIEFVVEEIEYEEFKEEKKKAKPVTLDDFRVRRIIDKGSFGEVFLTENINDGKFYAMKRIKKAILVDKSLKESTENEKEILLFLILSI